MYQTTIQHGFSCSGIGLHSGKSVSLVARPAPENAGVVFEVRTPSGVERMSPRPDAVIATGLATTLGRNGVTVSTVEHLLAAVRGLSIDNIVFQVEGCEVPILDGSAAEWVRLLNEAGVRKQRAVRRVLRLMRPVELRDGDKYIRAYPHNGFRVDCTIDFPHAAIGHQQLRLDINPETFGHIARARTFGFYKEVEFLRENGLALGGSLENAIVLGDETVLNPDGLRFENEFVRHKTLDFVGDMGMLALPLQGHFETCRSGHELNNKFARMLELENAIQEVSMHAVREPGIRVERRNSLAVPA